MIEDNNSDKQQALALINAYSIQEIMSIFAEIDEKILSLQTCSSEDFLTLNAYFKKYYAESKTISSNATELFNLITNKESRKSFFEQLDLFQKQLQSLLLTYETNVNQLINTIDRIILEMDQMFVTANNLKQDLLTLKLLVANLKLDIIVSTEPSGKMVRKTNDFNELIIQTKSFFAEFYKQSSVVKESLKNLNGQFVHQRDRNIQIINEILNETNYSTTLLDQKFKEAQLLVPKLHESTQKSSASIAKIITNLQYQDIIKQKIDHIQQTHKEVLKQIGDLKSTGNEEKDIRNRAKYFLQIRDVAGLQAAQLIHANKEYQKAIENISGKFLEVGADMTEISDFCHQLIRDVNGTDSTHFVEIRVKLEKTQNLSDVFHKSVDFLIEKTGTQCGQLFDLINNYNDLSDFILTIDKSITKSISNENYVEAEQSENTTKKIRNILLELSSINQLYHSRFLKIQDLLKLTSTDHLTNRFVKPIQADLSSFAMRCNRLIENLNETNDSIYLIIGENQILSKKISSDIKKSIEQIKYYDYFDKVIEEIIAKLNEIYLTLQNTDGKVDENRKNNLEYLRSNYTMESEHIIHDSHTKQKDLDIFSLDSTASDEEDDNLELF